MRLLIWGQRSGYTIDLGESKQKIILMPVYVYIYELYSKVIKRMRILETRPESFL